MLNFGEGNQSDYLELARKYIPDASMTASKAPSRFIGPGVVSPVAAKYGHGAYIYPIGVAGRLLDTTMGLGAVITGYVAAFDGNLLSRATPLLTLPSQAEAPLAEEIVEHWTPFEDGMVRILKTGSEATSAAIRLARAVTGKDMILKVGGHYHGWHDWALAWVEPGIGLEHDIKERVFQINEQELMSIVEGHTAFVYGQKGFEGSKLAAVIVEPEKLLTKVAKNGYQLAELVMACKEAGVLLIFDEILSGIRWNPTVAHYSNVTPDLITLGKAMGDGWPIAALVGPRKHM